MDILKTELVQSSVHRKDKVYTVNVISDGDPLEIFTEKDGEVIFKKYSPMGDLSDFADQLCESIGKSTGRIAAISDRDAIIALSGAPKRELLDKPNSKELERLMAQRKCYQYTPGTAKFRASDEAERYYLGVASPIMADGDILGCVMILMDENGRGFEASDKMLTQTAAGFLGRQMES